MICFDTGCILVPVTSGTIGTSGTRHVFQGRWGRYRGSRTDRLFGGRCEGPDSRDLDGGDIPPDYGAIEGGMCK